MTDQPPNINEFTLIGAYRSIRQVSKQASMSMFRSACKKARLCKTAITADLDIDLSSGQTISVINKHEITVDLKNGEFLSIDGKKMTADMKSLIGKISDSEYLFKIDSMAKLSMPNSGGANLILGWSELMVYFISSARLQFVKDNMKILDASVLDSEKQQIHLFDLDGRSHLSLFGRSCNSWKNYLLYVSLDSQKLVSVDLAKTLETNQITSTVHGVECFGFDLHKSGLLVCVSGTGIATLLNLNKLNTEKFDNTKSMCQIVMTDGEMCEAVGVSDRTILIGSRIVRNSEHISTHRLTMMSKKTFEPVSHLDIPDVNYDYVLIHSIKFITKRKIEFAVICTFNYICHLVAIRYHRLEIVQSNFLVCKGFINSYCQFDNAIILTSQDSNQLFIKLDVKF